MDIAALANSWATILDSLLVNTTNEFGQLTFKDKIQSLTIKSK